MSLWKADYLEAKYKGMTPRFPHTKKLLRSKNVPKKLSGLTDAEVDDLVLNYKREEFEKKWHLGNRKLTKALSVYKDDEMLVDRTHLIVSKLVRLLLNVLQGTQRKDPPAWVNDTVRDIITNQTEMHPSTFFKGHADDKSKLAFVLKVWNAKSTKKILAEIEWLFRMIRGNLTSLERRNHAKAMGKPEPETHSDSDESDDDSDDHDEFEGMVALELDDDDGDRTQDSFFKDDSDTDQDVKKYNLPELVGGYASLSEDEEPDASKTEKKNRRGQRARQRIWKKKFGSEAKHVKLQREQEASERRQRQLEYEERCRKREQKAREEEERKKNNPNYVPLKEKKEAVHPSWEAKRKAQEQLSKVEFSGKKIKFD